MVKKDNKNLIIKPKTKIKDFNQLAKSIVEKATNPQPNHQSNSTKKS